MNNEKKINDLSKGLFIGTVITSNIVSIGTIIAVNPLLSALVSLIIVFALATKIEENKKSIEKE